MSRSHQSCNIYNLDEKGFMMGMANRSKVIVCRRTRLHAQCQDKNQELVMVVECICADGTVVSPMIIYKGSAHYYGWYPDESVSSNLSENEKFIFGYSEKRYINAILLIEWLQTIFEPQTAMRLSHSREWRVLIWDG